MFKNDIGLSEMLKLHESYEQFGFRSIYLIKSYLVNVYKLN